MQQNYYKENHYVAQWYQRLFLPSVGEQKFRYLDLHPDSLVDPTGKKRQKKTLFRWGTDRCFKQTNLYTTRFGVFESTEVEQFFFGRVDREGREAVEYFSEFTHPSANGEAFQALLRYMSVQKLRTPKGLAQLSAMTKLKDKNEVLSAMQQFQNLHCAIWTEAVWSITQASDSTKFIISDHPVTVYNEDCFPESDTCRGFGDPESGEMELIRSFCSVQRRFLFLQTCLGFVILMDRLNDCVRTQIRFDPRCSSSQKSKLVGKMSEGKHWTVEFQSGHWIPMVAINPWLASTKNYFAADAVAKKVNHLKLKWTEWTRVFDMLGEMDARLQKSADEGAPESGGYDAGSHSCRRP
jgi:hypothetical protein